MVDHGGGVRLRARLDAIGWCASCSSAPVNTAFSYCVYALMLYFGMNYAAASLIALVLGILFSFRTQGAFVFYNSDKSRFGRFVVAWGIIYVCNIAFIRAMLGLGISAYVAGALALPLTTFLSYVIQKHFGVSSTAFSPDASGANRRRLCYHARRH